MLFFALVRHGPIILGIIAERISVRVCSIEPPVCIYIYMSTTDVDAPHKAL